MLGVDDATPLYRFLSELSFVDETPRGLVLHGVVRRSVFEDLRTSHAALVVSANSPSAALVQVVTDALDELGSIAGYTGDADVLRATFFGIPRKHEAIAAGLGLPFGTFRHRVRRATARLAELLWRRELDARK